MQDSIAIKLSEYGMNELANGAVYLERIVLSTLQCMWFVVYCVHRVGEMVFFFFLTELLSVLFMFWRMKQFLFF